MALVAQLGNAVIRRRADEVEFPLTQDNLEVIDGLVASMREASLVGMAAPQIGSSVRIFVTEVRATKHRTLIADKLRVFINPSILSYSETKEVGYEGCGSIAEGNLFGEVERPVDIEVRYTNELGEMCQEAFSGFLARVIQHEFDHLEGVVFTDKLYTVATLMSGSEFRKMMEARRVSEAGG